MSFLLVAFTATTLQLTPLAFNPHDARWSEIIDASTDPVRTRHALDVFDKRVHDVDDTLLAEARVLLWAAGTTRDGASTEGLVTPIQGARALQALKTAPQSAREIVDELMLTAESDGERAVILKAMAARALLLDKPAFETDMRAVAEQIRGKPLRWILENTTCYGTGFGAGFVQTYKDSCMPAIKLVAEAEQDPLAALRLHHHDWAAGVEREELESAGGVAVLRSDAQAWGRGTVDHRLLLRLGTDLAAKTEILDHTLSSADLDHMEQLLLDGVDLPLRIATKENSVAHSVIIVDTKRDGEKRLFRVHDPWTGLSAWFGDDDVLGFGLVPTDHGEPRHVTHAYLYEP